MTERLELLLMFAEQQARVKRAAADRILATGNPLHGAHFHGLALGWEADAWEAEIERIKAL